ncbi:hypothetical protein PR002_g20859, partial [Phytophthora rubi]
CGRKRPAVRDDRHLDLRQLTVRFERAICFNWFLFARLDGVIVLLILLWLLLAVVVYFGCSRHHSLAFQRTHVPSTRAELEGAKQDEQTN